MKSVRTHDKKKVASCFPSFSHYVRRRHLALRIKEINMKGDLPIDSSISLDAASETSSISIDPIFIGKQDDEFEIVEMLTTPIEKAFSILPIVGMGKTTLVCFNHEKTKTYFGLHIWVHVPKNLEVVALLKKIMIVLKPEEAVVENKEVLAKKLRENLGGKNYLLVFDDVWNEDRQKWEDFINLWSGITSTKENGILVTTTNIEVGSIVNTIGIHQLNGLSEEDCWSIIKDKLSF